MSSGTATRQILQEPLRHFEIDPAQSKFTIQAFATGIMASMGHDPKLQTHDISGTVDLNPEAIEHSLVRITIKPESFECADDVSADDRRAIESKMKEEMLEISRFPNSTFESTSLSASKIGDNRYMIKVNGNLTLHGTTRGIEVYSQATVQDDSLQAAGQFALNQTDFGIKLVSVAVGMLKVKDQVKASFEIVARKTA